jgi:hypothetical protein
MTSGFSIDMTQEGMREKIALTVGRSRLSLEIKLGSQGRTAAFTVASMKQWLGIPHRKRTTRKALIKLIDKRLLDKFGIEPPNKEGVYPN